MTTINKLTRTDVVIAGDVVPVYVQNQGDARGAAMSVILAYIQTALTFPAIAGFTTQYAAPSASGFSVQVTDGSADIHLILTPTGPFAAGTIVLPLASGAVDGQTVLVNTTQAIAAVTFSLNGASSIIGGPVSFGANDTIMLKYDAPALAWYMVDRSVQFPLANGGALGTPASGNLTNCTGYDMADLVGLAAGVATFLAAPSSANLAAAVTGETGSGALVFGTSPTLVTPNIGGATADYLQRGSPVTKAGNFSVGLTENWIICNGGATITVTLPAAASFIGREIMMVNRQAFTVVSATANVVNLLGGAAATAIMPATAGRWVSLVSDGTNWITMNGV